MHRKLSRKSRSNRLKDLKSFQVHPLSSQVDRSHPHFHPSMPDSCFQVHHELFGNYQADPFLQPTFLLHAERVGHFQFH